MIANPVTDPGGAWTNANTPTTPGQEYASAPAAAASDCNAATVAATNWQITKFPTS